MTRFITFSATAIAIASLGACAGSDSGEDNATSLNRVEPVPSVEPPPPCDPPPVCDPNDPTCVKDPIDPSWCEKTAAALGVLLAEARSCNIASAGALAPCDGTLVPTVQGCAVPVSSASSKATIEYLELFELFAQKCALPVPPCPNPQGVPIDCVQSPDVDSLIGQCSFTGSSATTEAQD